MSKDCTYSFTGPSGAEVVLRGQAAIKAFLANGGLQYLREPEARQSAAREITIDLSADRAAEQPARDWIKKVYEQLPRNPMNPSQRVMMFGEDDFAVLELGPSGVTPGAVEIKWIQAYPLRGGNGTKAIRELQRMAAEDNITLDLFPWDKGRVSQANLIKFYKSVGFEPIRRGSKNMIWRPDGEVRRSAERLTDTPEFKRWFGDSKVVDADGKPLVVYHGTFSDFERFDSSKMGANVNPEDFGFFFTNNPIEASAYADPTMWDRSGPSPNVMPVYLSIKNPKFIDITDEERAGVSPASWYDEYGPAESRSALNEGHDGLIIGDLSGDPILNPINGVNETLYVAFEPEQIKSAIGNNGQFDPKNPDIRRSAERLWYSPLERAIEGVPARLGNQSAAQWAQWLKANASKLGVKQDEITWSGIEEFLKLKGKEKVSKEEIGAFLAGNGVRVTETTLGGGLSAAAAEELRELRDLRRRASDGDEGAIDDEELDRLRVLEERAGGQLPAQYGKYTLPGGTNYREVLLTLPARQGDKIGYRKRDDGSWEVYDSEGPFKTLRTEAEARDWAQEAQANADRKANDGKSYRSSHWDQPNILAHIRVNDRKGANGERVLFVEEVQSDWAQEGKKKGFDGDRPAAMSAEQEAAIRSHFAALRRERPRVFQADATDVNTMMERMGAQEMRNALVAAGLPPEPAEDLHPFSSPVPRAPFVTKTDAWVSLALKRVIKMAADEGYDKVAFVNGDQSAERYDLSKQVDRIEYADNGNGRWHIGAWGPDGAAINKSVSTNELPDVVGKEIAQKIVDGVDSGVRPKQSGHKVIAGLDLKVGGEGMKAFYDQIVPQVARDLVKKMGGQGLTTVDLKPARLHISLVGQNPVIYDSETGSYYRGPKASSPWGERKNAKQYLSMETAKATLSELAAEMGEAASQPGFAITDAMRDKAAGGMPLFSRERDVQFSADRDLQQWAQDARDGKPVDAIAGVSERLPHASLRMAGLPKRPVVITRFFARDHLRNSEHPEITPEVIGKLPAMLANPRIVIKDRALNKKGEMVERWQLLAAERDDLNRPILIALSPEVQDDAGNNLPEADRRYAAALAGRGDALAVNDIRTMFGRQDSLNYVLRNLREGNVVYMPDEEVAHLREVIGAETPPAGKAGANPATRRATVVTVSGDKALRQFESGNPKWADAKLSIALPFIDKEKIRDVVFSAERVTDTPEFKRWSGDAPLVRMGQQHNYKSGEAVVVEALHGTTNSGLSEFSRARASIESDFGAGFYASNTPEDVAQNYANVSGPDLTNKLGRLAERIAQDLEEDPDWSDSSDEDRDDEAHRRAAERLTEMAPNTLKLYVKFKNPAVLGGNGETYFDYNEEYEEGADAYGEPTGMLVDFVNALDEAGGGIDLSMRDLENAKSAIWEAASGEGLLLGELAKIVKEKLIDASGADSGDSASSELLRQALQGAGFDGVIDTTVAQKFKNMKGMRKGTVHFIAFEPTQLKSAIGNDGSFDDNDPNILSSAERAWQTPGASKFDDVVYKLQDKQIDLKRVVEAVKDARGEIRNDLDTYLQEELFHGRAAKRTEDFVNKELQPLVDEMAKRGLTIEDLDQYLHARHAPEANRLIAERNPDNEGLQDGGSGMKTQDAIDYMAGLGVDKREHLAAAAAKVDAILAKTRKLVVDYELESRDTVSGWGSMFEHYVPLMREDDGDAPTRLGTGQGFSIKGREVKSRTGSTRKVVDILANIAMQRERTIVRGEKNRVAQSLAGLAKANPNEEFWRVDLTPMTPTYDPKKGVVVQRPDPMFKSRPNVVVAKLREEDGSVKEHAVIFSEKDARAMRTATALKNLDAAQLEGLMGASAGITRYFAAVNTQYNPVFGIVNLVRDVQGALINLQATELAGKQRDVAKNTLSALRGIFADARAVRGGKTATSAWAGLWEDFQDVGGQTGFRQLFSTSSDRAEAIQKALNPDAWMDSKLGKIFTANGTLRAPLAVAMKGARWIFDWLSDYNLAMENGIRLATYKAGLDAGMSRERAASLAKNLTVNFNRKGQIGQQAGAVYAFFNASMQGTARLGQVLFDMEPGKPKTIRLSGLGKKIVAGGLTLGAMQALALAAAGFSDDDPPDFVRERALIIPTGGKSYISIPMPLGFHLIPSIGRMTTEWALGGFQETPQRVVKMLGMFADTFNPIGNAGISMQTLAPTALDPLVALTENRDWQGRPIAKESMNKAMPGHALARDTATAWSRLLSETINAATGGNQYLAGAISPTPDQIDYLIGQLTGGVGREISKVEQTTKSAVTGEELPLYKIPLVGRFVGNAASQASEGNAFYANTERLNRLETEIKGLQKDGKMAEASALRASRPDAYLMAQANLAERQIAKLRKEKSELVKDGAPREQVRAVEERITARMAALNRAVEALKERAPI